MIKKTSILAIAICLAVIPSSCGREAEVSPTIEPPLQSPNSPQPTSTDPSRDTIVLDSGMEIFAWGGGTGSIEFDLDGDGEDETMDFAFPDFGQDGYSLKSTDDMEAALLELAPYRKDSVEIGINGNRILVTGEFMQGIIMVADIDTLDGKYEIIVPEEGPSSDYFSTFIGYDGNAPYIMGKAGGIPGFIKMTDGSGVMHAGNRGGIICTWFYDAEYIVEDGYLTEVKNNGYVNMDLPVTANLELPLRVSPEDGTLAYTMKKGDKVRLTWTDDERWVCVENAEGAEGWFEVEGFSRIKITGREAGEVFDGLNYAD